jgi:hypothetical protein
MVVGSRPDEVNFLNLANSSGHTRALGFIQPITETNTGNRKIIMFLRSKARPVRRADNLIAICESIVFIM